MRHTCDYCHKPMWDHETYETTATTVTCYLRNGLTVRTLISDRASCATGSDTSTGRHSTSGAGASGAHSAVEIMARIDSYLPSSLHLRDSMAKWRANNGRHPEPGQHATKCPYAEDTGHTGECVFDTRMHGAVLVRPTGQRVAA